MISIFWNLILQEESPEGGRFKKEIVVDGQSYLLLIRDEGGPPELQVGSINSFWKILPSFSFSLPPGWTRWYLCSASKMKPLSTPSTTITPRWPNIEIFKTSLSSWLELKVSDIFSIILQALCFAPVSPPVSFCLKTFLLSEDRFQYKGAAHSKLTRPALSSLKLFAWHRGVLRQVMTY